MTASTDMRILKDCVAQMDTPEIRYRHFIFGHILRLFYIFHYSLIFYQNVGDMTF